MSEITATPGQLVRRALLLIGATDRDKALTGSELNDGLDTLNTMLASWASNKLKVPVITKEAFSLSIGHAQYEIGETAADWVTDRPLAVLGAYIRDSANTDYALEVMSRDEYNQVAEKGATGRPYKIYYYPSSPDGSIKFDRTPSSGETIYLDLQKGLGNFTDPDTDITLPANYIEPVIYNLAIRLAPEYGLTPAPEVYNVATDSLNDLKVLNSEPFVSDLDLITLRRRPTNSGFEPWGDF